MHPKHDTVESDLRHASENQFRAHGEYRILCWNMHTQKFVHPLNGSGTWPLSNFIIIIINIVVVVVVVVAVVVFA